MNKSFNSTRIISISYFDKRRDLQRLPTPRYSPQFFHKTPNDKNSLSKLTKCKLSIPQQLKIMIKRLEVLHAFTSLFFTDKSYLSKGLSYLLIVYNSNKTLLRTKFYLDKLFIAKFIFLINNRIKELLMMMIISDLKLNRFFCDLLQSIRVIAKDREPDNSDKNITKKKRKQNEQTPINKEIDSKWKLTEDKFWQT